MDNSDGLDDFLNGSDEPAETAAAAVVETTATEAVEAPTDEAAAEAAERARGKDGRFASKGEKEPGAAALADGGTPPPNEDPPLDHAALLGERRRRQEAERRLQELEAQAASPPAVQPPAKRFAEGPPDRFEDPDGYDAWLIQTVSERARSEALLVAQEERITLSGYAAREKYPDWEEKATLFVELIQQNPALETALRNARNPAEYAYSTAKMHMELAQHGSLDALIAARVAEAVAKAKADPDPNPAPGAAADTPIPESLAGSQSARAAASAPAGPPSLDDILNPPKR